MYTKLRDASNAPVTPGPATSVKNLATRLLKYFRLRWLGDEESQFYGKVKCGRGRRRRQCGIRWTVSMATDLGPRTKNLGAFVNGNDKNMIWDAMLNEMVQRYPQVAAGAIMWVLRRQPEVLMMIFYSLLITLILTRRMQTRIPKKGLRHLLTNTEMNLNPTRSFNNWQWAIIHWNGGERELASSQSCPNWHECTCVFQQQVLRSNGFSAWPVVWSQIYIVVYHARLLEWLSLSTESWNGLKV